MQITTSGKKMAVTEAMVGYVDKKLSKLDKYFDGIIRGAVILGMESKHHLKGEIFYAECKLEVPGTDLFAKSMAKDVYAAIDLLNDALKAELKKYKQHLRGNEKKKKVVARDNKEYNAEVSEEEEVV